MTTEADFDPNWICSFGVVNCPICRAPVKRPGIKATRKTVATVSQAIAQGLAKVKVSALGAVTIAGLTDAERGGLTDLELYRNLMANGGPLAKAAIARAEQMAGRTVKDPANHAKQSNAPSARAMVRT